MSLIKSIGSERKNSKGLMAKLKYSMFIIIAVALVGTVASQIQLGILSDSNVDYRFSEDGDEAGTWEIYFTADKEEQIEFQGAGSEVSLQNVEYFDGSWNTIQVDQTDPLLFDWPASSAEYGRITYDINEFDEYSGVLQMGDQERVVETAPSMEQTSTRIDFSQSPLEIPMRLCGFAGDFWECDPGEDQPGYDGEIIDLATDEQREFELPEDSSIRTALLKFETVEDESFLELEEEGVTFANLVDNGREEVLAFEDRTVLAFDQEGELLWDFEANEDIMDVSAGRVQHDEEIAQNIDNVVVSTEDQLIILESTGSELWSVEAGSVAFEAAEVGQVSADQDLQVEDTGSADDLSCLGCDERTQIEFDLPFEADEDHELFYLQTGLNFIQGTQEDLNLYIGESEYGLDTESLSQDNIEEIYSDTGEADQMLDIGDQEVVLESLLSDLEAKDEFLRVPLALGPGSEPGSEIEIQYGEENYFINADEVEADIGIEEYESVQSTDSLIQLKDNTVMLETDENIDSDASVYLEFPINRHPDEPEGNIGIEIGETHYSVATDQVDATSHQAFGEQLVTAEQAERMYGDRNITFELDYDIPEEIESEKLFLRTALTKTREPSEDLTIDIGEETYTISPDEIDAASSEEYSINDGTMDGQTCVGCEDNLRPEFELTSLEIDDAGETADISAYMCREGDERSLEIGRLGLDSNYDIEEEVPACSEGFQWVSQQVDGTDIRDNYLSFICDDCDEENHYVIAQDVSTGGSYSRVRNQTSEEFFGVDEDFMVNVSTDTALQYDGVKTEIDRSQINENQNITFSCASCGESDHYRLMLTEETQDNTYRGYSGSTELIEDANLISQVWTNSSLQYDTIKTSVNAQDFQDEETEIEFTCEGCQEGYNLLADSESSGDTQINGEPANSEMAIDIRQKDIDYDWIELPLTGEKSEQASLNCENCDEEFYVALDDDSGLDSYTKRGEDLVEIQGGSMARIWSNKSLNFDFLRTEIDSQDIQDHDTATIECVSCGEHAFNMMVDENSNITAAEVEEGGLMVRLESFGSNLGNEIAAGTIDDVRVFNSTGNELWSNSTDTRVYDVAVDEVDADQPGHEITAATRSGLEVYSSTGELIRQYPEDSEKWLRSVVTANLHNGEENQIIVGRNDGTITALHSNNTVIWDYEADESIRALSKGNIVKESDTEILAGLGDGRVKILDKDGELITTYQRGSQINSLATGDLGYEGAIPGEVSGDEIGVSTSERTELFNFHYVPRDFQVEIGSEDYSPEQGVFRGEHQVEEGTLIVEIENEMLDNCDVNEEGLCEISVTMSSSDDGEVRINQPEIEFYYDLEDEIESTDEVIKWAQTEGITAGNQIRFSALNIVYNSNPVIPIKINRLTSENIQDVGSSGNFGGEIQFNDAVFPIDGDTEIDIGLGNRDFWLMPSGDLRESDKVWYDSTAAESPIGVASTDMAGEGGQAEKNVTVERINERTEPPTHFENVTIEIGINESKVIGNNFLEVDWNGDGNYQDITPSTVTCEVYEEVEVNEDTFEVCMEDTTDTDKVDKIEVIQPEVASEGLETSETQYKAGGDTSFPPKLKELEINPNQEVWGSEHNVNATFEEHEDTISADLMINYGEGWINFGTQETDQQDIEFQFESEREWVGDPEYRVDYVDLDEDGQPLRETIESSERQFEVNERPINVNIDESGKTEFDRVEETNKITANVFDGVTGETVEEEDSICYLYTSNGETLDIELTESQGQCELEMSDLENMDVGTLEWFVGAEGNEYYLDDNTDTWEVTILGNFKFETDLTNELIYLENNYGLEQTSALTIFDIEDLTEESIDPSEPDVTVEWGSAEIASEVGQEEITSEVDSEFIEDQEVGDQNLTITIDDQNFNEKERDYTLTVKDSFESILSSSEEIISQDENIDLIAEFQRSDGENVEPENISFETPEGHCIGGLTKENSEYICEFSPSSSLESDEYSWTVEADKELNKHIPGSDSFEIAGAINADVEIEQEQLYRYAESEEGTNELTYSIENITDESGEELEDSTYRLFIEDDTGFEQLYERNTGDQNHVSDSYVIEEDQPVGPTEFRVEIESEGGDIADHIEEIDVFGTLTSTTTETNSVYTPNTETFDEEEFNTETELEVEVQDQLGNNIIGSDITFNTPEGSCSTSENNCIFEPDGQLEAGEYAWNASVTKEFYEGDTTNNENLRIKEVLSLADIEETERANFGEQGSVNVQLENARGDLLGQDDVQDEFEAYLETQDQSNAETLEGGSGAVEWNTVCEEFNLGEQELAINLQGQSEFYSIYDNTEVFDLEVFNALNVEIEQPLNRSEEDAQNYQQGDNVELKTSVVGECGAADGDFDEEILWSAESEEAADIIGGQHESSWSIEDEFSGITEITVEVQNDYYEENTDQVEIIVDEVITLNVSKTPDNILREIDDEENWEGEFETQIVTGQGINVSEAELDEDWENFEVEWYVEDESEPSIVQQTDSDGKARANIEFGEEYDPGEVELNAFLDPIDDEELDTRILAPEQSEITEIIDESEAEIIQAPSEVFYLDEEELELSFEIASGNINAIDPSFQWRYERPEDGVSFSISSDRNVEEWAVSSSVYGDGELTATIDDEFIEISEDQQDLTGKREAEIDVWAPTSDIPRDEVSEFTAEVDIPGLSDASGYDVTFSVFNPDEDDDREIVDVAQTDEDGNSVIQWDANEYDPGLYTTFLEIDGDEEMFIEAGENNEEEREISIADDVEVTAYFKDNLEAVPGTRDEDNIHGIRFNDLPRYVVYRNAGPWQHPTEMYLGVNLTAPKANQEGRSLVDEAEAIFEIEHDETGETYEVQTCEINTEDPQSVNEDFFGFYGCETIWDASETNDLEVGSYTMTIDINPPSEDWSVQEETDINIEVRGQLEVEITDPDGTIPVYEMGENNNITLSGNVYDMEGNTYTEEELDAVRWELGDSFSLGGTTRSITERDSWSNHENAGRNQLNTWIDLFNPDTSWRIRSGTEYAFLYAEKEYFEPTLNTYRQGWINRGGKEDRRTALRLWNQDEDRGHVTSAPNFEGYVNNFGATRFSYRVPMDLRLGFPEEITDTDDNDIFTVRADAYRLGTETTYTRFRGNYELQCLNCSTNTQTYTQHASSNLGRETAEWDFDFSEETYNEYYEFELRANSGNTGEITSNQESTVNEVIRVVRDLGAGEGDCEGSADDPVAGENVEVCPNEYGFEDLPQEYWLNETADNLRDFAEDESGPEDPEDFDEEEHDLRWKQYQQFANESNDPYYEDNVRWYGEHSAYDDLNAGGCDFDGETDNDDDFFEARETCTDWVITAESPVFESIEGFAQYYRGEDQEPIQSFEVEVDYPTQDHFEFRIDTPVRDNQVIDPEGEEDDYPHTYEFNIDPSAKSDNFEVDMEAITEELETEVETVTIYEDEHPAEITSIDVPDRNLNPEDTEEVTAQINLGTNRDGVTVTADGGDGETEMSYNSAAEEWTAQFSPTEENPDEVEIRVRHESGYDDSVSTESYEVNEHDPVATIIDDTNEEPYNREDTITLDLSFDDGDDDLDSYEVEDQSGNTVCSSNDITGGSDSDSCDADVADDTDSSFTYTVYVEDSAGREGQDSMNVELDNDSPDIETIPYDDTADEEDEYAIIGEDAGEITLEAEVIDDEDNLETVEFREGSADGSILCDETTTGSGGIFECSHDFGGDTTQVYVIGEDSAGNSNNNDDRVLVVTQDPDVTITSPNAEDAIRETVSVSADIVDEDDALDPDSKQFEIEEQVYDLSGGSGSFDTNDVPDGEHTITATADDFGGNTGSDSIRVYVDNSRPDITFDSLSENQIIDGDFTFEHTITNDVEGSDIDDATYDITTGSASGDLDSNYDISLDTETLDEGDHTIEIEATDEAGNTRTITRDFNVNNEPPEIELENPDLNSLEGDFYNEQITAQFDINDEAGNDDPSTYRCEISGENVEDSDMNNVGGTVYECVLDISNLDSGEYTLIVDAEDTEDLQNSEEFDVSVDTDNPNLESAQIPDEDDRIVQPGTEIGVDVEISDDTSEVVNVEADGQTLSQDGGIGWSGRINAPNTETSSHNIEIFAEDEAGNTITQTTDAEIEVDDTIPNVINFDSDAEENADGNDISQSAEELEFSVDATDDNGNLDEVRIVDEAGSELNQKFAESLGGVSGETYTLTITPADLGLSAGTNNIEAVGEDLAENTGINGYTLVVEDDDPVMESIELEKDIVQDGTSITVTADIEEEYLEVVEFQHKGTTIDVSEDIEDDQEDTQEFEASIEADGNNEEEIDVTVYAEDSAGNEESLTASYQIDEESPVIQEELTVEGGGEYISRSDNELLFELEATDNFEIDRAELHGEGDSETLNRDGNRFFDNVELRDLGCAEGVDFQDCDIAAEVYDEAANMQETRTVTVTIDDDRPEVSEESVDEDVVQTGTEVTFEATISDGDPDLITEIRESGQTICQLENGEDYSCAHTFSEEGDYNLDIYTEDRAGNINDDSGLEVTVTDTSPIISNAEDDANEKEDVNNLRDGDINEEEDTIGVTRSDETIRIDATVFDEDDLLQSVNIQAGNVNTGMSNTGGDEFTKEFGPEQDNDLTDLCSMLEFPADHADCTFSIVAEDEAGNIEDGLHTIILDDSPAEVEDASMEQDILTSGSETMITVELEDNQGDDTVEEVIVEPGVSQENALEWNGEEWSGEITVESTDQDDSVESLQVISTDYAGNEDVDEETEYILDERPPENIIVNSDASQDISQSSSNVEFTVEADDNVELSEIRIGEENEPTKELLGDEIDSDSAIEAGVFEPGNLGCVTNGDFEECEIEAEVIDEAGNKGFGLYNLTIDDQDPTIEEITLQDSIIAPHNIVQPNEQVDILIDTGGESDERIERFEITGDAAEDSNIQWDEDAGNWTGVIGLDGEAGERTFEVFAEDWAENENTQDFNYIVDDDEPNIENLQSNSTNDIERSDTELVFTVQASDENGLNKVNVEGKEMEFAESDIYELETTPSELGCTEQAEDASDKCEINATAIDNAGFENHTSYEILIENDNPTINEYNLEGVIEGSPFDSSLPDEELDLKLNVTNPLSEVEADLYAKNHSNDEFIGGPRDLGEAVEEGSDPDFETYEETFAPEELDATEWNVSFVANVTDQAGNTHEEPYTLNLDTVPPNLQNLVVNNTEPETTRDVVEIKAEISHFVDVEEAYVNITQQENESFFEQRELEIEERDNDEDIDSGNFTTHFTPPESGTYDAVLYAEDIFQEFDDARYEDIFTAKGETDLNIQMSPESQNFEDINIDNPGIYEIETIVTNVGETTAYDVSLQPSNVVTGIESNITDLQCGNMASWEECSVTSEINVTAEAGPGTKTTSSAASWENPDRTTDGTAEFVSKTVEANPEIDVTSDNHSVELFYQEEGDIEVRLFNRGNTELNEVEGGIETVSDTDPEFVNSLGPDDYSIETPELNIGEEANATITITGLEDRGEYPTGFGFDATESNADCTDETCSEEVSTDISLYKRSSLQLEQLEDIVYREGIKNIDANVTDDLDDPIPEYNVSYIIDQEEPQITEGVLSEIRETDGSGDASAELDLRDISPGEYFVKTSIESFENEYYRATESEKTAGLEVRDELNTDIDYLSSETFWYEDEDPIEVEYTVTDIEGEPVDNADIVLSSNATTEDENEFIDKVTDVTNTDGEGRIEYNTDRNSSTKAEIISEVSRNEYYDGSPYTESKDIEILGGFSAIITAPEDSDQLIRGREYDIQASLRDNDGNALDPEDVEEINWTIYEEEVAEENVIDVSPLEDNTNETVWNTEEERDTGEYIVEISADDDPNDDEPPVTDTVEVGLYEPATIENVDASTRTTERKDSTIDFSLDVKDSNNEPVANYRACELLVSNELINSSESNTDGECSVEWNTDKNSSVGDNNAEVLITEYRNDTWYLPDPEEQTEEEFEITLTEEIDLDIIDPDQDIYSHRNVSLTANATDAYNRSLDTSVEWFLNNDEDLIGEGNETEWDTSEVELGEHILNSTAEKEPYNSTFNEKDIRVFGEAEHTFNLAGNYTTGTEAEIEVVVNDTNTGEPVENQPVKIYKNNEPWTELTEDEDAIEETGPEGNFTGIWDTSEAELGDYNITTELMNSTETYYNETTENITRQTSIVGEINTEVRSISEEEIYRDQLAEPLETTFEIETIDDFGGDPVIGAENNVIINEENVGNCETDDEGTCEFTWNPSNSTEIGKLQGYVNATVDNYLPDQSEEFNITVRTGSKPRLDLDQEQGYNFSESEGIEINSTVLESFTEERIENYDFELGWGTREPVYEVSTAPEDWEESEQISNTDQGLLINNTSASKDLDLEGVDVAKLSVDNNETEWEANITTLDKNYVKSSNSSTETIELSNSTIEHLEIKSNDELTLIEATLASTEIDNRRELMDSQLLGNETVFDDLGNFEGAEINTDYFETIADDDDEPRGWYVLETNSVTANKGQGTFGTPSLQLEIEEQDENETSQIIKEYDTRTSAYEDTEMLEFWMNSPLDAELTLNAHDVDCSTNYRVEAASWEPSQVNITDFHNECSEDIDNLELEFNNTVEEGLNTTISVDQFRRYEPTDTAEKGIKRLNWLPTGVGTFSFKLEIDDAEYYNTTDSYDIVDLDIFSTGGGLSPEDEEEESDVPDESGGASSFSVNPQEIQETAGKETFGETDPIKITNEADESINISFGVIDGELIEEPEDIVIESNRDKQVEIPYETSELGLFQNTLAVFNSETDEREDVNVTLDIEPVETNIENMGAENSLEDIIPGDKLEFNASITVDDDPINESVDWSARLENEECTNIDSSFIEEDQYWNIECEAPEIEFNPINVDTVIEAEYQGVSSNSIISKGDNNALKYRDITGPFINSTTSASVEEGEAAEVEVTAWDNVEIDEDRIDVKAEYLDQDQIVDDDLGYEGVDGEYSTTFTQTAAEGDYDIIFNLTDVNSNHRTVRVPVSVHDKVDINGSIDGGSSFEFRRPGTDQTLESFSTEEDNYDVTVQNRSYDIEITTDTETTEGYNQEHSVDFQGSEIGNNTEDPVNISGGQTGDNPGFGHPEGTTNYTFSSIEYNTSMEFTGAEITLDYRDSGVSPDEEPEEDLNIYRCPSGQITNCTTSDWEKLETDVDTDNKKVNASTGTSSSYIIERESSDGSDEEDDGGDDGDEEDDGGDEADEGDDDGDEDQDAPGGGGGVPEDEEGGSDEDGELTDLIEERLGAQMDDLTDEELDALASELSEEELDEMSEDELMGVLEALRDGELEGEQPLVITPRIYHPVMERGETRTFFMEISNNQNTRADVELSASGEIEDIITFVDEVPEIPVGSSTITEMIVDVPEDAETGSYSGTIKAVHEDFEISSDHQILVVREGIGGIQIEIEALTQTVSQGSDLAFEIDIGSVDLTTPINTSMEYFVRESETDEVVAEKNETVEIDSDISFQREIELADNIDRGSYYIQTVASAENVRASDSATFSVGDIFWTPFRRNAALLIIAVLLTSGAGWGGYRYYLTKRRDESRYVFPVDYSKLPETTEDNYNVGKVAETEQEAFIDPDDLTTHAIVSGSTGSGKSVTASVIVEEALENDVPVVVFDPTAQWTGFVKELKDDNLFEHYPRFDMDKEEDPHPYRGTIQEIDSESPNINFEDLKNDGEITVFTLNKLTTEQFDQAVRKIIDQIFEEEWEESPELELLIVFDEVHRLLEEYGGQGGYHALEKGAREFRKWGIGLMMCSQVTADFKQAISGNIMTEIQMQTKSMSDIDRVETKYGEEFAKRISSEDVGVGMIQNSNYNDGDPWFVDFRPTYHNPHKILDKELEKYHTLSEELSELKQKLEAKKEKGEDVRDKDLELQLAENKLKEGRFKMAKMYIDSLKDEMDL